MSLDKAVGFEALGIEKGGEVTAVLENLVEAGFLAEAGRINPETGQALRQRRFRLRDNYARFCLKCIAPHKGVIDDGAFSIASLRELEGWDAVMGLAFENLVTNNYRHLLPHLHLEGLAITSAGPYLRRAAKGPRGRPGCQIDLMIQTRRTICIVEAKRRKEIGRDIIDEVDRKVRAIDHPAVFCNEMAGAARVLAECRALGIAVPDDIAILSCGDFQYVCENQSVPISCIPMNGKLHGYEAAALLARLMDGEKPPVGPVLVPPGDVTVRASTDHTAAADPLVARALALLAGNLSRPWGVAQMAEALGVTPLRLARHFQAELGRTPGAEILRQRLVAARNLLRDTDLPLDQIAAKCGFCHASYLVSRFRRDTGLTPRAWRTLHGRSGAEK